MDKADQAVVAVVAVLGVEPGERVRRRMAEEIRKVYTPRAALTKLQLSTLDWWANQIKRNGGVSPTMQEAADAFGVSKVSILERVQALVNKGYMVRADAGGRANRAYLPVAGALEAFVASRAGDGGQGVAPGVPAGVPVVSEE